MIEAGASDRLRPVRIVSVNVGGPREVEWQGQPVRTSIYKSPVSGRVPVRHHNLAGDAQSVLPRFAADSADAMFLDADKRGYPAYLEQALRIVRRGGLIMADNAFAFGELFDAHPADPETPASREIDSVASAPAMAHTRVDTALGLMPASRARSGLSAEAFTALPTPGTWR